MVMRQFAGGENNLKHMWLLFFPCVKNEATILLIECDLHPQDCYTRYNILVMVAPPPNQIQLCTLPECPCLNVFVSKTLLYFLFCFYKTDTFCGNIPIMRVSYLKNFLFVRVNLSCLFLA